MFCFPRSLTISQTADEFMLNVHKEYSISVEKRSLPSASLGANMPDSTADINVVTAPQITRGCKYFKVENFPLALRRIVLADRASLFNKGK
jgi:hypothetical protein